MVEKFINYSEDVETVNEAFTFAMDHMDEFSAPSITISAYEIYHNISTFSEDNVETDVRYGVSVSGTVN